MVRDDEVGDESLPRLDNVAAPFDPFQAVRERLAAAASAIDGLQQHVHPSLHLSCTCKLSVGFGVSLIV